MTVPGSSGAHPVPDPRAREAAAPGDVRPAEQIRAAHDTYDRGEIGSVGALVGDITQDLSTLMRQEVALAKAEVTQSAKQASKGAGMFAGAGYAGHLTVLFLSFALWWALGYWFDNLAWAALVVAVLWGVVAAVLALRGRLRICHSPLALQEVA